MAGTIVGKTAVKKGMIGEKTSSREAKSYISLHKRWYMQLNLRFIAIVVVIACASISCSRYLIITDDALHEDIQPLAEARTEDGFIVRVVQASEIGENPSSEQIANYIRADYAATTGWRGLLRGYLRYVLLVGDVDRIPTHYSVHPDAPVPEDEVATDLYYGTIRADSYLPRIAVGRLPVAGEDELRSVVNKIVNYRPGSHKALLFGNSPETSYAPDDASILESAGFEVAFSIDQPAAEDIAHFNDGVALATYYGHGWKFGMSGSLSRDNLDQLHNSVLPVILSGGCATGWFDDPSEKTLGELLLLRPDSGAVAFLGGSRTGGYGYQYAFIDGFFGEVGNSARVGRMLNQGRLASYQAAEAAGRDVSWHSWTHRHLEQINLLGDPALKIRNED